MRIVVHDFIGHPFQVQLSRELAARGHQVLHLHFPGFETPKGALEMRIEDPPSLQIVGVPVRREYAKYSYARRYLQDREYARACIQRMAEHKPDIVLSGNAPPTIQRELLRACTRSGISFIPWVQDVHAAAVGRLLRKQYGLIGCAIGQYFRRLENRVVSKSSRVIYISEDFIGCHGSAAKPECTHVIPNWAVLPDLPVSKKKNAWSSRLGLAEKFVFLYSGTLGMKHNPALLLDLAEQFRDDPAVEIVVASQGLGREWLHRAVREQRVENLLLLNFQTYQDLPEMLGTADVLVAILEDEAGVYSVPSKILTYLCAERPVLVSVPSQNRAARIVSEAGAGIVADPKDRATFLTAARALRADQDIRKTMALNGRRYAEQHFDIRSIANTFERVFQLAIGTGSRTRTIVG